MTADVASPPTQTCALSPREPANGTAEHAVKARPISQAVASTRIRTIDPGVPPTATNLTTQCAARYRSDSATTTPTGHASRLHGGITSQALSAFPSQVASAEVIR